MSRRHGWQLPAHTLQVVAITVFFLLCIAFYSFFCPFVGKDLYQYVTMGVYSFLALSVLILYVRCTAIDPADPGILIAVGGTLIYKSEMNVETQEDADKSRLGTDGDNQKYKPCLGVGCFCCNIFMKEDCCKDIEAYQQEDCVEEALYCTLCNAEVCKNSKHCRSCDKCVDGFDHHCRWLNNCVGRKNYISFLCLMAVSLAWLAVESGVGIAVLVRCFTNKAAIEDQIGEKLGYGLSRAPFATIVALGTALSLLASVPLGELFFFHMILIRKGITTYEYVVAMRAQSEPPGPSSNDDQQSLPSSPMSSAPTAFSGSSFGRHYKGTWCTPPRIFVDQDEIIPHLQPGRVPSTVDPDYMDPSERVKQHAKRPVRISAWKLAKLDSNEAIKAAAKARASSSVLKPINTRGQYETDQCSSGHLSSRSSAVSGDTGFHRDVQSGFGRNSRFKSSYPPSRASVEDVDTYPQTPSSYQSNSLTPTPIAEHHPSKLFNPIYQTSANRSPFSAKSGDVKEAAGSEINNSRKIGASNAERSSRSSVYWDQEAGRFVSAQSNQASSSRSGRADLLYTGQSIFFGGPLVADPATRSFRDPGSSQRSGGSQLHQLPVFVPSDPQKDELAKLP